MTEAIQPNPATPKPPGPNTAPLTATDFRQALLDLLPQGWAWPRDEDTGIYALCDGLAQEYARSAERLMDLVARELWPPATFELLPEWEAMAGLPDDCVAGSGALEERRLQLVNRLTARGGQTPAFYLSIAERLGYSATLEEFRPFTVGRDECGGTVPIGTETLRFYWRVRVLEPRVTWFRAGAGICGQDPLATIVRAEDLECLLQRYKPAHTRVIVGYEGDA